MKPHIAIIASLEFCRYAELHLMLSKAQQIGIEISVYGTKLL